MELSVFNLTICWNLFQLIPNPAILKMEYYFGNLRNFIQAIKTKSNSNSKSPMKNLLAKSSKPKPPFNSSMTTKNSFTPKPLNTTPKSSVPTTPTTNSCAPTSSVNPNLPTSQDTILYTVRFQNTGNDTAFNIRIEDILDKKLDWTTFHPITASHDYRTELNRETGLVTFYFDDILLPDSTTSEPESHGFVMFGIASLENLEDKTEVDNTASIFFDFNPPIITNVTTLTLLRGDVGIEGIDNLHSILIRPNPFSDYTTIEVDGLSPSGNYTLEVRDILGRKVRELKVDNLSLPAPRTRGNLGNGKANLERGDLASGLYLIQILKEGNNEILGSGKVLVE